MDARPRDKLREWATANADDPELLQDAQEVKRVLQAACPNQRLEVSVLVAAVEEGIPLRISRFGAATLAGQLENHTTRLHRDRGLETGAAWWTVQAWAWALGKVPLPADAGGSAKVGEGSAPLVSVPRERLQALLRGASVPLDDHRRIKALLLDACPDPAYRRETTALFAASEEGIPARIGQSPSTDPDALAGTLEHDRGLTRDVAVWAARSWAWALGVAPTPQDVPAPLQPTPPQPPPGPATPQPTPAPQPGRPSSPPPPPPPPVATPGWAPQPVHNPVPSTPPWSSPSPPAGPQPSGRRAPSGRLILVTLGVVALLAAAIVVANAKGDSGSSTRSSVAVPPGQETILRPDQVEASSSSEVGEDAGHNPIRYDAQNVADGDPQTTWRTPGDGRGESVTLRWNRSVHITSIGLIPGYAKTDPYDGTDRFAQERRIAQATYAFGDGTRVVARFTNSREPQFSSTNVDADSVTIQIDQTTPHHGRDFTAISEVIVKGAG